MIQEHELRNKVKQLKNAKRHLGHRPEVKDEHKRIRQDLIKLDKKLDALFNEKWAEWKGTACMHAQGFADGIEYAQRCIQEVLEKK